jgi:hypothetical protein
MKINIIALGIGLILVSCGIFTPSRVEEPAEVALGDPFRLYSILDGTGEQFSKKAYEDILSPDFQFVAWDNAAYGRQDVIEQLNKLKMSCNCAVSWDSCKGVGEIRDESSMTLCRTFYVKNRSQKEVTDTGKVEFGLIRSSGNIWTVVSWKEGLSRSMFHP